MTVAVTEECIGTGGCESKSAALRVRIKQSCEVGTVCVSSKPSATPRWAPNTGRGDPTRDLPRNRLTEEKETWWCM